MIYQNDIFWGILALTLAEAWLEPRPERFSVLNKIFFPEYPVCFGLRSESGLLKKQ
jgi:hypothetical protein